MNLHWYMFVPRGGEPGRGFVVQAPTEFMAWSKLLFGRATMSLNYRLSFDVFQKEE